MATATKQPDTDPDERYNTAQNLWDKENNFSERINEAYRDASSSSRGSSDVAESTGTSGFIKNLNADPKIKEQEEQGDESATPFAYNSNSKVGVNGGRLKRFGASGGIVGMILFSFLGVGGATTILGSSLLVNMKEIFHSDRADASRANEIFSKAVVSHQINYNAAGCGKVAIKCRMGTMSDNALKSYENSNFKVKGDVFDASGKKIGTYEDGRLSLTQGEPASSDTSNYRYIAKEITFPDGKVVSSGSGFFAWADAYVQMKAASIKAFNPRSAFFLNNRFGDFLSKGFNFSKGSLPKGATDEELNKSFNQETGGATEEELKNNKGSTALEKDAATRSAELTGAGDELKKTSSSGKLGNILSLIPQGMCQAYSKTEEAVAVTKLKRLEELVAFALPWFQAADAIKNHGSAPPELVNNLSNRLTSYRTTGSGAGLTATDSQGYAIAAYGDRSKLKDFAQKWLLGNGIPATIETSLEKIITVGHTFDVKDAKNTVRYVCKALSSPKLLLGALGLAIGDCLSSLVGNEATGPEGCIAPFASLGFWAGVSVALSVLLDQVGSHLVDMAVQDAKDLNLGSDLIGVDAGNAIAAGAGLMLGASATDSGLRPSTSVEETQGYIAYTDSTNNQYIAAEQYNARDTPFDVNNQYSFLGSIISNLQLAGNQNNISNPLFSSIANVNSLIFSAFNGSGTANALYSQPSYTQAERYDCADPDLQSIGVIGDKFCSISTIMPTSDLQDAQAQANGSMDNINDVIDYMTQSQGQSEDQGGTADDSFSGDMSTVSLADGDTSSFKMIAMAKGVEKGSINPSIDDTGKPIQGSQYSLYLRYCTDARIMEKGQTTWDGEAIDTGGAYWGTTQKTVDDGSNRDQDWYSGKQCTDPNHSKMMKMFREYTNYCLQIATMDGTANCWDTTTAEKKTDGNACSLLNNAHIHFENKNTQDDVQKLCNGETVASYCPGKNIVLNPALINALVSNSSKYDVTINNFGFHDDRFASDCDQSYQHWKGNAVDLSKIQKIGDADAAGNGKYGSLNYATTAQQQLVSQYATDFVATLPNNRGGVGQQQCGVHPTYPPGVVGATGYMSFPDECSHLHIDVRDRNNINGI